MNVTIYPSPAHGTITAPPSKSAAHRLLICAGLSRETSVIHGISDSEDMGATIDCLRALGAQIDRAGDTVTIRGAVPAGTGRLTLPCRESGSTLRFLIPSALLREGETVFTGSRTLFARPLSVYDSLCRGRGLPFALGIDSLTVRGKLTAGAFGVPGDVSSQFVSGLLFALPLLSGDSRLCVFAPVESRPYIDMTLSAMRQFGVTAEETKANVFHIPGGQSCRGGEYTVEGDWSNAAFFEALRCLGGDVRIEGLDADSLQGDKVCCDLFARLRQENAVIDLTDCPDLGPVCMAFAAMTHGATFRGTRRLRIKESDRCAAMAAELAKCGVQCEVGADEMTIPGGCLHAPKAPLYGHNDHRIVMALSVLLTRFGGRIEGAEAVRKSMPDFFSKLTELGIEVQCDGMDT